MKICSELLKFQLVPDESEGILELKLSDARFCRVRHCPVCQWRRSLMWKARAYKILPQVVTDYPNYRWLFVTLTVKNCQIKELRENLDSINKAFKRFTELKVWPAKGWVKSIEVTKGRDGVSAHPHLHILAMVPPSYFSHAYLSHAKWVALWQQCLRIDYHPVVHTSAIAKHHNPSLLIPEILKYQVKESDLVGDREWFLELTRQLHKSRAIAVGGILRQYMRELEEKNQDLIDESEETDEVDGKSLYFRWERKLQRFNIE
ncbi:replication protein [Nostoc sp. C057]|uniref:protein rep n=1 Tax=Nostoc sp. C057 TaxID=2576903 RepID=UPI0015C372DB|nr:protein rep [Nostoc sp. C057]QLE50677.1 replication protein [Nostoc sp. C057]